MDDLADGVEVVEADEALLGDLAAEVHGAAVVLVALDELEEVHAEDLEDHAEMVTVWALVEKGVEEVEDVGVVAFDLLLVRLVGLERFNPLGMISIAGNFL